MLRIRGVVLVVTTCGALLLGATSASAFSQAVCVPVGAFGGVCAGASVSADSSGVAVSVGADQFNLSNGVNAGGSVTSSSSGTAVTGGAGFNEAAGSAGVGVSGSNGATGTTIGARIQTFPSETGSICPTVTLPSGGAPQISTTC